MSAGRKREFDKKQALRAAMLLFWEKGYAATSLSELCQHMGINKPSLYAAFGNKDSLHLQAIEFYYSHYGHQHLEYLNDTSKNIHERLSAFLISIARMQFDTNLPKGCLVALSAQESASANLPEETINKIRSLQESTENMLVEFFQQGKANGELEDSFDSEKHAVFLGMLIHGSAAFARIGKNIAEVEEAFALALKGIFSDSTRH